jgi:superfamily II DNA/RNA helicase
MQLLTQQRMICNGIAQLNFATEWSRLDGQVATPALLDTLFMPKLPALRGIIEQLAVQQRRKVVVFSQWRNMLRLAEWSVRDLLTEHGMRAVFFTGAESAKLRERAIVEFHDHASVSVMFLSDAGGVGLNLQRAASCCINLEMPWNPAVLEQRIGRIYRLGQTAPIDVYNLVSEDGIEANIAQLVARKKAVFSSLFDGTTDEVRFDGSASFLETVRKIVEPVEVPGVEAAELSDLADLEAQVEPSADADVEPSADADVEPSADTDVESGAVEVVEPSATVLDPRQAARALAGLSMERLSDGSIRIHAAPEAAAPLAELFESFARALRAPGPRTDTGLALERAPD